MALPAAAQLDTTRRAVIVRAGPDNLFPQVARLPNASTVRVFGCTANPRWCDVLSGRTRGWVPVNELSQSSRLRNAPAIAFSVVEYWDARACVVREPRQLARLGYSGMAAAGRKSPLTVTARSPACVCVHPFCASR